MLKSSLKMLTMILIDVYNVPPVQLYVLIIMYDSIE